MFVDVIAEAQSSADVQSLLADFFTYTERIMLPKRLCIAYLLLKKYDQRAIASYLKVSFTTINRVSTALKTGGQGYTVMLTRLQKREKFDTTLKQIEEGIISMLASMGGPSTLWKNIRNEQRKHAYEHKKPF
ncbi:MAG: Trp family transcriptional regulator [Candidatus Gottesmanbacteria bacterium]|nr:Trp family transcriptional regulator [Candidatus Gottesmanbacteria bacterium]